MTHNHLHASISRVCLFSKDVQTKTGGYLTRYFNDEDLTQLLTPGNPGTCEVLERFPDQRVDPKSIFPTGQKHVHGVMQHDAVYQMYANRFSGEGYPSRKRKTPPNASELRLLL